MTADEFRVRIAALGHTQRGFAAYVGANERTVRRWADGEQDIPPWVNVMLGLMEIADLDAAMVTSARGEATEPPAIVAVDLKPCPFCGGDDLWPWQPPDGTDEFEPSMNWVIWCQWCAADGPVAGTPEAAALAWNRRGDDHK